MSDPQPVLAGFRPDATSAFGAVLVMLSVGLATISRPVTGAYGAGSGAQYHDHNPYGGGGGNDGGGIGGRCSSKLDATLQQMFRKISGSSGGGSRSAYFPPFQLDDDDDDNHPAATPFSRPRPAVKSRRRSLLVDDDDTDDHRRHHHLHHHHHNDIDAAAAATQLSDAADAEASQSALLAHLARLQRRHQRHNRFHSGAGFDAPYDLRADGGGKRFDEYRNGGSAGGADARPSDSGDGRRSPHRNASPAPPHRIHVAELRVRVPNAGGYSPASADAAAPASAQGYGNGGWVRVDRCQFQAANRTLDTRLTFPDLTISGRVQLQPPARSDYDAAQRRSTTDGGSGGCTMILRLRQAGIEFRTVPLRQPQPPQQQQQQRSRRQAPSVRTDSYFAQPGFVSVFAHGCDALLADAAAAGDGGAMNGRRRRNRYRWPQGGGGGGGRDEERREGDDFATNSAYAYDDPDAAATQPSASGSDDLDDAAYASSLNGDYGDDIDDEGYMNYGPADDFMRFSGDILGYAGYESRGGEVRTWPGSSSPSSWQNVELANSAERDEQRTRDLEGMFARGVRGLLTSYMQRALQPAIKETLMESLGYRLSYG